MAMADLFSVPTDFLLRDEIETLEGKPLQDKGEYTKMNKKKSLIEDACCRNTFFCARLVF